MKRDAAIGLRECWCAQLRSVYAFNSSGVREYDDPILLL